MTIGDAVIKLVLNAHSYRVLDVDEEINRINEVVCGIFNANLSDELTEEVNNYLISEAEDFNHYYIHKENN